MNLGELLDGAFRLYRERFGILVLTAEVFLIPMGILSSLILSNIFGAYMNIFRSLLTNPGEPPSPEVFEALFDIAPGTMLAAQLINIVSVVAWSYSFWRLRFNRLQRFIGES